MLLVKEIAFNLERSRDICCRVFHGRGGTFAGFEQINIEWYPPYLFIQNFSETIDGDVKNQLSILFEKYEFVSAILLQSRTSLNLSTEVLFDRVKTELPLTFWSKVTHDISCHINLGKNRNTGVFLDMRAGWDWVRLNSRNKHVLNLFSYTSIFSLFALKGKANSVVNLDMAAGVLKTAQRNHSHNELGDNKASFYKRDILKSASQYSRQGPYDLIIIDPPPYQKKSFRGWTDYEKLLKRCEKNLNPQGSILASLNNPHVSIQEYCANLRALFPDAKEIDQVETSSEIKEVDVSKGLKLVIISF